MWIRSCWAVLACVALAAPMASASFVNFENPHVHPIDISPDGNTLAVCNTPDNRVEVYSLASGSPVHVAAVPVGIDPVSVRFRTNSEVWAVNHISDTVSVIDLTTNSVVGTVFTLDEPCDVVFAGTTERAFVSCSQVNTILVVDPLNLAGPHTEVEVMAEDPRALAVSTDGSTVYAAIFESGNASTILAGGADGTSVINFPPDVVAAAGPHAGMNPPFNDAAAFDPPKNPANGTAPEVGLIVKQDASGDWLDDTGSDWSQWVDGVNAGDSGRPVGWTLLDHDIAVIDADTLALSYVDGIMNINMALAVNPSNNLVSVVGTEATNEVRFEPVINGTFVRVLAATTNDTTMLGTKDLNEDHLAAAQLAENSETGAYDTHQVSQAERDKSIGDPRGLAWNAAGTVAYVTGMGSNNMVAVDVNGDRVSTAPTIELREGPTGLVVDDGRGQIYVVNKFDASLSVVSIALEQEIANLPFHDPTPNAIKTGRKHLYDTHKNSGLGQVACASCHLDSRMDRLAWDLGDPAGELKSLDDLNLGMNDSGLHDGTQQFHPMKGPMTTQTLQGIIGHEPFHWRGDRLGLEEFNPAFIGLQGDDTNLTPAEMQEFEDFLATIFFPPTPYRNLDNSLPTSLPLDGHYTTGRFGAEGQTLPNGDAVNGLALYRSQIRLLDAGNIACVTCHVLPSGAGADMEVVGGNLQQIPPDPITGARHLAVVSVDGSTNETIKIPHLRNVADKVGFSMVNKQDGTGVTSRNGFGFLHDGSVDSIERFVGEGVFQVASDQEVADLVALMLAFPGSDFGVTNPAPGGLEAPGVQSNDVHAAVGQQETVASTSQDATRFINLIGVVDGSPRIEMIMKGVRGGGVRGALYLGSNTWQTDSASEQLTTAEVIALTGAGTEQTFTVVPAGTGVRMALDRDLDGEYDQDEIDQGSDPADPDSNSSTIGEGEGEGSEGEGEGAEGEGEDLGCNNSTGGVFFEGDELCLVVPDPVDGSSTYQWERDFIALANGGAVSGADERVLRIFSLSLADSGEYSCIYDDGSKAPALFGPVTVSVVSAPATPGPGLAGMVLLVALCGGAGVLGVRRRR